MRGAPQWPAMALCLLGLLGSTSIPGANAINLTRFAMDALVPSRVSERGRNNRLASLQTEHHITGDPAIASAIGNEHLRGLFSPADPPAAARWHEAAAANGSASAHLQLALIRSLGLGLPRDDPRSLVHLTFAASDSSGSRDSMQAATGLGYRHLNGHGVHESCHSALLYYHQAARAVLSQVGRPGGHSHVHTTRLGRSVSARSAYTRERDIVQYYEYSAETGNADAQNALGQLHMLGVNGLDKDHATARKYFEKASNRGDPEALANLGMMYANGLGCRASNETAVRLMRQAAQSGNHLGQAALGCMHLLGLGVSRDPHKAAKYIHASAEQGDPSAQFFLAVMHLHGEGVKRDGNRALHWMALAAHRGDPRAMYHLAIMQLQNNPARCTQPATLLKAVAEKGAWAFVMEDAHEDYVNGRLDSALFRYLSLAEAGMEVAQWNAGVMLEEGAGEGSFFSKGSNERLKLAQRMYRRSADQGYPAAILKVGDSLFEGWTGDPSDKERAAALYRYASENSRLAEATFNLGLMHELGNGLPQDLHLAKRYYDLARSHHSEATLPTAITLMRVSFKALQAGTYDQLGAPSASSPPSTALAVERSSGRLRIMSRSLALPLVSALSTLVLFLLGSLLFLHTARRVSAAASERRAEEDALHQHAGNEGQERTGEQTEQEESGR